MPKPLRNKASYTAWNDPAKIAITFEHNPHDIYGNAPKRRGSSGAGYNFAYALGKFKPSTRASTSSDAGGYGAHAILFKGSGLALYHDGDREEQVCFWGPSANTAAGMVITYDGTRWKSDVGNGGKNLDMLVNKLMKQNNSPIVTDSKTDNVTKEST